MNQPSPQTPYDRLGGAAALRTLTRRFYQLMDERDDVRELRVLHPPSLDGSEQKLFEFFSGWLGGPPLFAEKYGHPMLRARHLPFSIGDLERDQWMTCMHQALDECVPDAALRKAMGDAIGALADHMRNRN